MVASRSGSPDVVEQLLAKGANVNARGARGQTALMWAVAQQHAGGRQGAARARRRRPRPLRCLEPDDGGAAARHAQYNRAIPHGGDTALMFAARVGDLALGASSSWLPAPTSTMRMRGASARRCSRRTPGIGDLVEFLLDKGADPNSSAAGFTALHEAVMRRDERWWPRCSRTAPIRTRRCGPGPRRAAHRQTSISRPQLVGATPFWLAARFTEPDVMRLLVKHGADPLFVHRADYTTATGPTGGRRRRRR